jgi:hypothetical protein
MNDIFTEVVNYAINRTNFNNEIFDSFIYEIENYHNQPAHNIFQLKQKNTKYKGILLEFFCKKYFEKIEKVENAWLLKDCPSDILQKLSLDRKDYGIDIIIQEDDKFSAVQCKYKAPKKLKKQLEIKYNYLNVTWRDLSTFYSLCARSGPIEGWHKMIIFTNTKYVNRKGKKNSKDRSICYNSLKNLSIDDFRNLINENGKDDKYKFENVPTKIGINDKQISIDAEAQEHIIERRLNYFNNLIK